MRRVVITGCEGLLGRHAQSVLHAHNCAARFQGAPEPWSIRALNRADFNDDATLQEALEDADGILHFAGVNRGPEEAVEHGNIAIATRLATAISEQTPHIVYANSMHAGPNTPYGRGKAGAVEVLATCNGTMTNLVLPHIFGEGARPHYNNVTATLIFEMLQEKQPAINPDGQVQLLHAGAAAQTAIDAITRAQDEKIEPQAKLISVPELWACLKAFHENYVANIFPDLRDAFDLELFNTYRAATYPDGWPRALKLHSDARGVLFEAVKGGGGGQSFVSTTKPGVTRGNHFHLRKVERFLVLEGEALIRMRGVLDDEVWEYHVTGSTPVAVDMPTLYTHSIENIGSGTLTTLFWTHDVFDPNAPDTYADEVLM